MYHAKPCVDRPHPRCKNRRRLSALGAVVALAAVGCSSAGGSVNEVTGTAAEALTNILFTQLTAGLGNGGNIQVLGVGIIAGTPGSLLLDDWQNGSTWTAGQVLSNYSPTLSSVAVVPGACSPPTLQVVGLASSNGYPYAIADQDSGGSWHTNNLQLGSIGYSAIAAAPGTGSTPTVQVVTLANGLPYLAAWQDDACDWHGGFQLSSSAPALSNIILAPGAGPTATLEGLGLDASYGYAYLSVFQDDNGNWHSGGAARGVTSTGELPSQVTPLKALAAAPGTGRTPTLQALGLGQSNGFAYLVGWQDNGATWHSGFELPSQTTSLFSITTGAGTDSNGNPNLEVLGLTESGEPYLAAYQDDVGGWHADAATRAAMSAACNVSGVILTQLVAIRGDQALQVIGYSPQTERTYLACYQTSGTWHSGFALP
jgi:hypothetical protein